MDSKRRLTALALALLVATLLLASPAFAGRWAAPPGTRTLTGGIESPALDRTWLERSWSWILALFGEENGGIVPCLPGGRP